MVDVKIIEGKMEMKDVHINTSIYTSIKNDVIERILNANQYIFFITSNPNKTHEINKMVMNKPIYIFTLREKPTYATIPIFTEESNISNINGYNGIIFSKLIDMIGLDNVVKCYNNEKCRFSSTVEYPI